MHTNQFQSERQAVIDGLQTLGRLGLNRGSSGNVSVRLNQDCFLISPSGVNKDTLTPAQLVLMSIHGDVLSGGKPSTEWMMHRDIYASRPEVNAVVHTHSDQATALACARKEIPPFHYMVAVTGSDRIRCAPYALFGSKDLSMHAVQALKGSWACLLANHGVLAVHTSLAKALYVAQEVESLATQYIAACSVGQPQLLSDQQMQQVMDQFTDYGLTAVPTNATRPLLTQNDVTPSVCTLRWCGDYLEMIDQRLLPRAFELLQYRDAEQVAQGIRTMVVRGAPAIGVAAAYGMALEALKYAHTNVNEFKQRLDTAEHVLATSRPTAVNLCWALKKIRESFEAYLQTQPDASAAMLAKHLVEQAQAMELDDVRANQAMGTYGAALLPDVCTVLTHCNAGALATAGHGTALGVIRSAVNAGKRINVFADETRPFLQGARLTAWELLQDNIPVTLLTDNAAGWAMQKGLIDAVIVGADRIAANGDVANKIGTYMVAVLAKQHNIPFYVAAPLSTVDMTIPNGLHIPIEMRDRNEVLGYGEVQWAPSEVDVFNPSFDVTPAHLITAIVTEKGVVHCPSDSVMREFFERENPLS